MSALPVEVLRRILRFVTRDDIECAMLASRQLRAILEAHPKDMPQRAIEEARVEIENESAEGPFLVTLRTPAKTLTYRRPTLREVFLDLTQCIRFSSVAELHISLREVKPIPREVSSALQFAIATSRFRSVFVDHRHLDESLLIEIASRVDSDIFHGISLRCGPVSINLLNACLDRGICRLRVRQQYLADEGVSNMLVGEKIIEAVFNPTRNYSKPFLLAVRYANFSNTFCKRFIDACRSRDLPSGSCFDFRAIDVFGQEGLDAYSEFMYQDDEFGISYDIANIQAKLEYAEYMFSVYIR